MKLLLSNEKIKKNISRIAKNLRDEYEKEIKNLTILTVLDGAAWFTVYLTQELNEPSIIVESITAKSYEKTKSTGTVTLSNPPAKETIDGRHIIVADDVYDTGTTSKSIKKYLEENYSPKSVNFVFMLNKSPVEQSNELKNIACSIGHKFVVGFGLDYENKLRGLKNVYIIESSDIEDIESIKLSPDLQ